MEETLERMKNYTRNGRKREKRSLYKSHTIHDLRPIRNV